MAKHLISRRTAIRSVAGGAALAGAALAGFSACAGGPALTEFSDQAEGVYEFNGGWLFGGVYTEGAEQPGYADGGFTEVTLPHTVASLSWRDWDPATWQNIWIYRRHFDSAALRGGRVFIDFDGVMTNARLVLNGKQLAAHQGGYLPWSVELTSSLVRGDNVLAVVVDSRWLAVPPGGAPLQASAVDFLQPGGIYRDVRLRVVPEAFISDVFAKPLDVLTPHRRVEVACTVDSGRLPRSSLPLTVDLLDGASTLASGSATLPISPGGHATAQVSLTRLGDVTLWGPDTPKLYTVRSTLSGLPGGAAHTQLTRIGFREASFELDGFYLNGHRMPIFGLNRHQLFPFAGMAAPERLQRRDAEILKNSFNCNMVRCSHYPQSPRFLDACDELGLMVWEEPPGWRYVGGGTSQALVEDDVRDMVMRDRNRPSVVIWGTRLNETSGHLDLYQRTAEIARQLDGTRQTSGAMRTHTTVDWTGDVFAFNDYHADAAGNATLLPPLNGVPYLVSEAVGTLDGVQYFRWTDPGTVLARQAAMHAQVHEIAQADPRYCGLLGWTGFDYASIHGHIWDNLKWPGIADTFRVPKPGAAFYRSQVDPRVQPVILPVFFWDSGPDAMPGAGGQASMIATNCDRLEIYAGALHAATGLPDMARFGHLAYPPVFINLTINPVFADLMAGRTGLPELRIDGYVRGRHVASRRMSADTSKDRLVLTADDASIVADGSDATRVTFRALDAYGNQRSYVNGEVDLALTGPASLIGDNPFAFGEYGGVGGAFIRSVPGRAGLVTLTAAHATLGRAKAAVRVTRPGPGRRFL
jgi:beta-galactosidase